jgi:hypothetical protein
MPRQRNADLGDLKWQKFGWTTSDETLYVEYTKVKRGSRDKPGDGWMSSLGAGGYGDRYIRRKSNAKKDMHPQTRNHS